MMPDSRGFWRDKQPLFNERRHQKNAGYKSAGKALIIRTTSNVEKVD
jgi:hypothetical protein